MPCVHMLVGVSARGGEDKGLSLPPEQEVVRLARTVAPAGDPRWSDGRRDRPPSSAGRTDLSMWLHCLVQKAAAIGEGMGIAVLLPRCKLLGKQEYN